MVNHLENINNPKKRKKIKPPVISSTKAEPLNILGYTLSFKSFFLFILFTQSITYIMLRYPHISSLEGMTVFLAWTLITSHLN